MKYSKIVNKKQYYEYCDRLLKLGNILSSGKKIKNKEELEQEHYILELIIDEYNRNQVNPFDKLTPVDLLKALMDEENYTGRKLAKELNIAESTISEILNYKIAFSKDVITKFAERFNVGEKSFMKTYPIKKKLVTV